MLPSVALETLEQYCSFSCFSVNFSFSFKYLCNVYETNLRTVTFVQREQSNHRFEKLFSVKANVCFHIFMHSKVIIQYNVHEFKQLSRALNKVEKLETSLELCGSQTLVKV